jgi:hypothetical protein
MMDETPFNLTTNLEQPGISVIRPDATVRLANRCPTLSASLPLQLATAAESSREKPVT